MVDSALSRILASASREKCRHNCCNGAHVVDGISEIIQNVHHEKVCDGGAESRACVRPGRCAARAQWNPPGQCSGASVQKIANAHDGAIALELKPPSANSKRNHKLCQEAPVPQERARVSHNVSIGRPSQAKGENLTEAIALIA